MLFFPSLIAPITLSIPYGTKPFGKKLVHNFVYRKLVSQASYRTLKQQKQTLKKC